MVNSIKILMFIDSLGSGGAQRQFVELASGLAARGHDVTVAIYHDQDHFAGRLEESGIPIVHLSKPSRFSPRPIFAFARLYQSIGAQTAIVFLRTPAIKAELARLLAPRMRIIAAERSVYPEGALPVILRFSQRLHRLARFITVNSRHQRDQMARTFPRLAPKLVVIRNGIFPGADGENLPARGNEVRLLALASLMPYKNSINLIRALAILRDRHGVRATISWAGETFAEKAGYKTFDESRKLLEALELSDRWEWLGVRKNVSRLLSEHDALIHPSFVEGTSNAVCEAMGAGRPVLAARIADHQDMIEETGAGMLFDPKDPAAIAATIARFAELDGQARSDMGRAGRKEIADNYGFERMVDEYEKLVTVTVSKDAGPAGTAMSSNAEDKPCVA